MKSIVTAVALFAATPAFAHHNGYINPTTGQREYTDDNYEYRGWSGGWRSPRKCYEKKYKEVYRPGTADSPGYVDVYRTTVEVPCGWSRYSAPPTYREDNAPDECNEDAAFLGGILGGGVAAGISDPDAMVWSIPLGIVSGAITGCQID